MRRRAETILAIKMFRIGRAALVLGGLISISAGALDPVPPDEAAPAPEFRALVDYRRNGGFAGFDDQLLIYDNGQAVQTRRGLGAVGGQLDAESVSQLVTALAAAQLCAISSEAVPPPRGSDLFSYTITDFTCEPPHTVVTADGAVSPTLRAFLNILDRLLTVLPAQSGGL